MRVRSEHIRREGGGSEVDRCEPVVEEEVVALIDEEAGLEFSLSLSWRAAELRCTFMAAFMGSPFPYLCTTSPSSSV